MLTPSTDHQPTNRSFDQPIQDAISYELLKLGYRLGMGATLGIWMIWDCMLQGLKDDAASIDSMPGFPAFCAFAGLLTLHWSWGLQVWVWTRFRIVSSFVLQTTPFEKQCIEE